MRYAGDSRHEGLHPVRAGKNCSEGSNGIFIDQSSSRLPDLRSRGRVPITRFSGRLRRVRLKIQRSKADCQDQGARSFGVRVRDVSLHSLYSLCSIWSGNCGCHGARNGRSWGAFGNHVICWLYGRLRIIWKYD